MENHSPSPPLTNADRIEIFKLATRSSFLRKHAESIEGGMTDIELENALKNHLGILRGSGGPECLSATHQGTGLKIWGGWQTVNHVTEKPQYSGRHTVAVAREVYGISDPSDRQESLF